MGTAVYLPVVIKNIKVIDKNKQKHHRETCTGSVTAGDSVSLESVQNNTHLKIKILSLADVSGGICLNKTVGLRQCKICT